MKMFLKQHKFIDAAKYVKYVDKNTTDIDIDGIEELQPYRLWSNKTKQVINLVTSEHFIEKASIEVCNKMSYVSIFGNLITENLAVMKDVRETINNLNFGNILDIGTDEYTELNVRPRDPQDPLIQSKIISPSSFEEWCCYAFPEDDANEYDNSAIYDMICESCTEAMYYDDILPITLEAYCEYFASLLTDEYNT